MENSDKLTELRERLDRIDGEIMRLFEERMEAAEEIGEYKRTAGLPTEDKEREGEVYVTRVTPLAQRFRAGGIRLVKLLLEESKNVQRSARNLYLIGMPDCGKTRMGKKLFAATGLPVSDTDKLIMTRSGRTIDEIFENSGEEAFREMETGWLRALAKRGGLIVATGGGAPMREENVAIMKGSGVIVFLDRKLEALHGQNTVNRPLLRADSPEEVDKNIDRLYRERRDRYAACADITVDPDAEGAAEKVLEFFLENR
ncbi:MAG: chorismate mutase [Clostridiales bacterium]|nr:chorismate mutase [Clostridiales bacterium]